LPKKEGEKGKISTKGAEIMIRGQPGWEQGVRELENAASAKALLAY
jgi:hypothetical protein